MRTWALVAVSLVAAGPAGAARLSMPQVNQAELKRPIRSAKGFNPVVLKAQVLLDRSYFSPGAIDATWGTNVKKALKAYQIAHHLKPTATIDGPTWKLLESKGNQPVLVRYKVAASDVKGYFVAKIPTDIRKQAKLKSMGYTSPVEKLAERFHMSERLLKALNPGANFKKAGTNLVVAKAGGPQPKGSAKSVVVDRKAQTVRAIGANGHLIAFYPATVGSTDFPSPKGRVKVRAVAEHPTFTMTSKLDYAKKKIKKGEKIVIPAGPNNPVGAVWIDLSKPKYGIHGTPEPTKISKSASHGCVRLTNWDAQELSRLVRPGTPVVFVP